MVTVTPSPISMDSPSFRERTSIVSPSIHWSTLALCESCLISVSRSTQSTDIIGQHCEDPSYITGAPLLVRTYAAAKTSATPSFFSRATDSVQYGTGFAHPPGFAFFGVRRFSAAFFCFGFTLFCLFFRGKTKNKKRRKSAALQKKAKPT